MIIIGLTGSMGMGKTTAARNFHGLGIAVHNADKAVHEMMAGGGEAVAAVEAAFPGVVKKGAVDRRALAARVFDGDDVDENLGRLEAILHPLVRHRQKEFLRDAETRGDEMVVLEVPLLLETGGDAVCDLVVVVSAPRDVQESRVLNRPGMTKARLRAILARQMADTEKRRRADFVIETDVDHAQSLRAVENIVKVIRDGGWTSRRKT